MALFSRFNTRYTYLTDLVVTFPLGLVADDVFSFYRVSPPGNEIKYENRIIEFSDIIASILPLVPPGGFGWALLGNASTVDGTDFVGTTDNVPLNFRVNNQPAGRIDQLLWNTFYGFKAGKVNTIGGGNTATGSYALNNSDGLDNTANGQQALFSNTTGNANTAIGAATLYFNTIGNDNTAIGAYALLFDTLGLRNTAVGNYTLFINTTGANNTAIGMSALSNNSTGINNTAVGYNSGSNNTIGNNNTIIGAFSNIATNSTTEAIALGYGAVAASLEFAIPDAVTNFKFQGDSYALPTTFPGTSGFVLSSTTTGVMSWVNPGGGGTAWYLLGNASTIDGLNFIGTTDDVPFNIRVNNFQAGRIESALITANTFFGYQAGIVNTGLFNTAVGHYSLLNNITGNRNTAFGRSTLRNNLSGSGNTAIGTNALHDNVNGTQNTATGFNSLFYNIDGVLNTANGFSALLHNTVGINNTAMGAGALNFNSIGNYNTAVGHNALYDINGDNNTAVGTQSGTLHTSGNNNTYIGAYTGAGITTGNSNTIIGAFVGGLVFNLSNNIILADGSGNTRLQFDSAGVGTIGNLAGIGNRLVEVDATGALGINTTVFSGTYTPTLTNQSNITSSTPRQCTYLRVGNAVTVSGLFDVTCTALVSSVLYISLPIPSNFTTSYQCGGVGYVACCSSQGMAIGGDSVGDRANVQFVATSIISVTAGFTFTYEIL